MTSELKKLLSLKTSKVLVEEIAKKVISSPELFDELFILTTDKNRNIAWHSLWACLKISESHPSFFYDKYEELANRAMNSEDSTLLRLLLNILFHLPLPKSVNVAFLDFCILNMTAPDKTSACQSISMKLAYKICSTTHPELLREIKVIIENMDESYYNPAAISTRKNILRSIKKYHSNRINE